LIEVIFLKTHLNFEMQSLTRAIRRSQLELASIIILILQNDCKRKLQPLYVPCIIITFVYHRPLRFFIIMITCMCIERLSIII